MQLRNRESLFFGLIFLLNLIPLFSGDYFVTIDGPAHLYNSNIINSLLLDKESFYYDYYVWNSEIVPNWIGHSILSFFGYFFPSFIAEKILMIIYSFTLCYGFRFLIKVVAKENLFLTYLIFPFVYMFFFFMGFYNFLIGLGLMFFSIGLFIKVMNDGFTLKNSSVLIVLLLLLYFSHAVTMAVFMIFVAFYFSIETIKIFSVKRHEMKLGLKRLFNKVIVIFAIGSVPFFLVIRHFYIRPETVNHTYMSFNELISHLIDMKMLIGLSFGYESFYLRLFIYTVVVLLLAGIAFKIVKIRKKKEASVQVVKQLMGWPLVILLVSILMMFFYFKLPFSDTLASFINTRFILLFFLLFIVWMASLSYPLLLKILSVVIVFYVGYNLNNYYYRSNKGISHYPKEIISLSENIPEKSVVLPMNFSNNWLLVHYSNYLGAERDLIILENYECVQDYFPIRWNQKEIPNLLLGEKTNDQFTCNFWPTNYSNETKKIDFIFIINKEGNTEKSPCQIETDALLAKHYNLYEERGIFQVYKAK